MAANTRITSAGVQGQRLRIGGERGAGFAPVPNGVLPPLEFLVGMDATALIAIRERIREAKTAACVEAACIDLAARASGVPAFQWLGGPTRSKVRGLSALEGASDEALARSAASKWRAGARAFRVPLPEKAPARAFVDAVKKRLDTVLAAAPEAELVLDGKRALTPGEAARLVPALEPYHLLWLNEPCPVRDPAGVLRICEEGVVPLGFGDSIDDASQFAALIDMGVVQCLRLNVALLGPLAVRKVAALGETEYLGVSLLAPAQAGWEAVVIQVAGSLANVTHVDLDHTAMRDGFALLGNEPGFGKEGA